MDRKKRIIRYSKRVLYPIISGFIAFFLVKGINFILNNLDPGWFIIFLMPIAQVVIPLCSAFFSLCRRLYKEAEEDGQLEEILKTTPPIFKRRTKAYLPDECEISNINPEETCATVDCSDNVMARIQTTNITINHVMVDSLVDKLQQHTTATISVPYKTDIRDEFARYGGISAELLTLDLMEGHDFEYWCANALEDLGFTDIHVTPGSRDQGVDILATLNSIKYAIQCKRYSDDLGNTPVQEVHAGKSIYHCHVAAVLTNRYFTSSAKELADATGVLLWDRNWIKQYLISKSDEDGSIFISHSTSDSPPETTFETSFDEFLPTAVDVILEAGSASVSILQRRLYLGYARCARIVDDLETLGIVGPFRGSQPREIYITKAEWDLVQEQLRN